MTSPAADGQAIGKSVAVLGCGHWGKNLVRNFHDLGVLRALCDIDPDTVRRLKEQYPGCEAFTTYQEALTDAAVRAVAIATPAESHGDLVRDALLAGKDVFVEKPLCLSVAVGEELVALARKRERILMVGHLLRYHPAIRRLKEAVDRGELGRIQYIYSTRLNLGRIRREENILWSFAPHDISVILGLLDEMPERVLAAGGSYLHPKIADVTMTLLEFASGVKAHIFVSWLHPFKEQKLVVVGDRKMAVFDDVRAEGKLVLYPHVIEWRNHAPVAQHAEAETVPTDSVEPLRAECSHFLECVRERARPLTDGEEGLRVLSVLEHCQDAIESRVGAKVVGRSREKRPYFVHESASVDEGVEIGEGTTIWHTSYIRKGSRVGKNCRIGRNVMIGPNVIVGDGVKIQDNISVYEGVTLEDAVFCGPAMVFTNVVNPRSEVPRMQELRRTLVKHGASLGANCTIICGRTIGTYAFVGAGAVVTRDVPDYAMVLGNPARFAWWMCACGVKLKIKDALGTCDDCGRNYRVVGGVRLEPAGESPKRVPGR